MTQTTQHPDYQPTAPQPALSPDLAERYLQAAQKAARIAGKIQMEHFGKIQEVFTKGTNIDLVTSVDRECDAEIVASLQHAFPADLFLTEESFQEGQTVDLSRTWVIDPLDGTTNYAHSFPQFAVSIAYFIQGQPVLGVIFDPFKQEMYTALRGRGAFLNDAPIFVSKNRAHELEHALLATGFPYDIATSNINNMDNFQRIAPRCRGVRRPGAAALDMAYVAAGRLDGFWELKLSLWDIAAGALLVEEAGGKVTGLDGGPSPYHERRIHLIASNGNALHEEIQGLLTLESESAITG
jgi:myo-inositol-1(or 4)-monophosphatase